MSFLAVSGIVIHTFFALPFLQLLLQLFLVHFLASTKSICWRIVPRRTRERHPFSQENTQTPLIALF